MRSHKLHSLWSYGHPLGVECRGCGHRALAFADRVDDFKGNMRELRTLRCACLACNSREWGGWLFVNATDRDAWLEGLVVSPVDGSRPALYRSSTSRLLRRTPKRSIDD